MIIRDQNGPCFDRGFDTRPLRGRYVTCYNMTQWCNRALSNIIEWFGTWFVPVPQQLPLATFAHTY